MGHWKNRWIQTPQRILMDPCIKQAPVLSKRFWIIPWPLAYNRLELHCVRKNNQFLIHFWMKMKSFCDYLGLSNSCSYDVDDVISRADRFGFQNFCSPGTKFVQMMTLGWHWPILQQGQIWSPMLLYGKKVKQWIFSETLVVYDIKVGRCSQLNEYMKLYEYQRSRSFMDLGPNHSDSMFLSFFSTITTWPIEAKFYVASPWDEVTKACSNCSGHMTKMATMPIYGEIL